MSLVHRSGARLLALLGLLSGCVAHRMAAFYEPPRAFGELSGDVVDRLIADGDRAFAARDDANQLDEAIRAWKAALRYRPEAVPLMVGLSRALRLRAISQRDKPRADEAVQWAERALGANNSALRQSAAQDRSPQLLFALAERGDLPALTAYADALMTWAELHNVATLLAEQARLRAAAARAAALDRTIDHGAADRLLGMLLATVPSDAGGDLRASQEHFEAALATAPDYLANLLAYGERYAVRTRDARLYRSLLERIVAADPSHPADAAPENRAAQRRAQQLLKENPRH
jgi:tetratricopeptide (TPR) repeat protein